MKRLSDVNEGINQALSSGADAIKASVEIDALIRQVEGVLVRHRVVETERNAI